MSKEMMSVTRNEVKFFNLTDITIQWQKISILYNIELKTITIQTMTLQPFTGMDYTFIIFTLF